MQLHSFKSETFLLDSIATVERHTRSGPVRMHSLRTGRRPGGVACSSTQRSVGSMKMHNEVWNSEDRHTQCIDCDSKTGRQWLSGGFLNEAFTCLLRHKQTSRSPWASILMRPRHFELRYCNQNKLNRSSEFQRRQHASTLSYFLKYFRNRGIFSLCSCCFATLQEFAWLQVRVPQKWTPLDSWPNDGLRLAFGLVRTSATMFSEHPHSPHTGFPWEAENNWERNGGTRWYPRFLWIDAFFTSPYQWSRSPSDIEFGKRSGTTNHLPSWLL